jgi:hypothetical protein
MCSSILPVGFIPLLYFHHTAIFHYYFKCDYHDASFSGREINIDQVMHSPGPIGFGAVVSDLDMSPVLQRRKKQKQVGGPFAVIFIIVSFWLYYQHRQGFAGLTDQLNRGFSYHQKVISNRLPVFTSQG